MTEYIQTIDNIFERLFSKTILSIIIISIIGLLFRIYFTSWDLPFSSPDAFLFMIEGLDYAKGDFTNFSPRFLWPAFNSIFFVFFDFDNYLEYTNVMRIISISISIITIPILYLVSKQIVKKKYALMVTIFFTIEPNLVENSIFSITEPIFILLGLIAFYFAMQRNDKYLLLAFFFAGLSFDTRLNGIVLLIVVLYSGIIRIKTRKTLLMLVIGLSIFLAISLPHIIYPLQNETSFFPVIENTVDTISNERAYVLTYESDSSNVIITALTNELSHIFRISIPYLIAMVPFGIIIALTNLNNQTKLVFVAIIASLIIAIPQYTMSNEYRNLFFLLPFFCIFSSIGIQKLTEKIEIKNLFLILLVAGLILLSANFLRDRSDIDQAYFIEKDDFGKYIANNLEGNIAGNMRLEITRNMPDLKLSSSHYNDKLAFFDPGVTVNSISQLMEYCKENEIDYLVIENGIIQKRYPIFTEIIIQNNQYGFLEEKFNSDGMNYQKFKAEIFKINWEQYNGN